MGRQIKYKVRSELLLRMEKALIDDIGECAKALGVTRTKLINAVVASFLVERGAAIIEQHRQKLDTIQQMVSGKKSNSPVFSDVEKMVSEAEEVGYVGWVG